MLGLLPSRARAPAYQLKVGNASSTSLTSKMFMGVGEYLTTGDPLAQSPLV